MNDREKLLELLYYVSENVMQFNEGKTEGFIVALADHLLANGVTVQRWIPVTERLPDEAVRVLVCLKKEVVITREWTLTAYSDPAG